MIDTFLSVAGNLFNAAVGYKNLKESKKAILRAYFFEIKTNLDLLKTIDLTRTPQNRKKNSFTGNAFYIAENNNP